MRILYVNTLYYPNMSGGAEQSVKLLAEEFANRNNDVAVFCIDLKEVKDDVKEYNNVKIFRKSSYKYRFDKKKKSKFVKIQQKLISYYNKNSINDFEEVCKTFKPDIIHTNSVFGMSPYVWKVACKLSIPVVHTIRDIGLISPTQYGHKANFLIKILHIKYMKYLSKYVTAVTAPSIYTLNSSIEKIPFKNAKIKKCIFNSVKIDYLDMKKIIEEKKKRTEKNIKFMYAGRLVYFKGIEHMIEAFEMIENKNCELHICGKGEMQEYVEEWSKKDLRIVYHGKLNNEELANCYKECDVLLVPSYWPEPFGRVLIEGNMYGLPVIAGNCGGMPEIIENTKGGVLYKPASTIELKEKMEDFLNRDIIKSYFDDIEKNIDIYDIKYQIDNYEEIYKNITNDINGGKVENKNI